MADSRTTRKVLQLNEIFIKEEISAKLKQISKILKKDVSQRTEEEMLVMQQSPEIVKSIESRARKRAKILENKSEWEETSDVLHDKCEQLASAIRHSRALVIYTGAGISTAASIPDYRGPNGVWTQMQKGISVTTTDLSEAEPTFTHMAIKKLWDEGLVSHVLSQNCDGLHLRSGQPRSALSEVHGNMFIEVCKHCKPRREYLRSFDVTERTRLRRHGTGRRCHACDRELADTIVHFGEMSSSLDWPQNWTGAVRAADRCHTILCLGSSLKVLRKYQTLWGLDRKPSQRPKLYVVNLQWTPKDGSSTLKINGRCDDVMSRVMRSLGLTVPRYDRNTDPIVHLAVPLRAHELTTTTRKLLLPSSSSSSSASVLPSNAAANQPPVARGFIDDAVRATVDALLDAVCGAEEAVMAGAGAGGVVPGWFGKGCARRKPKRLKLSS